jgi:hypothetical protein
MSHMTLLSHLKYIQYLTLKGNSVFHTNQFAVSHDPIEPLKGNSVSHTESLSAAQKRFLTSVPTTTTTTTTTTRCWKPFFRSAFLADKKINSMIFGHVGFGWADVWLSWLVV